MAALGAPLAEFREDTLTRGLRRVHRVVVVALAILLPVAFVIALLRR